MPFLITCRDVPNSAPLRASWLPAHRLHVNEHAEQLLLSGPLTEDDGQRRIGQVFVLDVVDRTAAQQFIDGDPFTRAGMFADIHVDRIELRFEQGRRLGTTEGEEEGVPCL